MKDIRLQWPRTRVHALVAAGLLLSQPAWSQEVAEEGVEQEVAAPGPVTPVNTGRLSFGAGVDFTNAYFFRGLLQEDQGFIAQPWAEASMTLYEGKGAVNTFGVTVGIWNSFQSEGAQASESSTLDDWYETDVYVGASALWFDEWTTGVTYTAYTSPSNAFATIHEVAVGVGYDDSGLWNRGRFANSGFNGFQPSITLAFELDQSVTGPDEGVYFEFKLEPGFATILEIQHVPITVKFPVVVGVSIDDYYQNDAGDNKVFGYLDTGTIFSYPLKGFVPSEYGAWEIAGGVRFLFLANVNEGVNRGDSTELVGTLGLSVAY